MTVSIQRDIDSVEQSSTLSPSGQRTDDVLIVTSHLLPATSSALPSKSRLRSTLKVGACGAMVTAAIRRVFVYRAGILRAVIAVILFLAVTTKTYSLTSAAAGSRATLQLPSYVVYGEIIAETGLLLWLIIGVSARPMWKVTTGVFASFACVSLYSALRGHDACHCFGFLAISPWWTFAMDGAVLAALGTVRPWASRNAHPIAEALCFRRSIAVALSVIVLLITASLTFIVGARKQLVAERAALLTKSLPAAKAFTSLTEPMLRTLLSDVSDRPFRATLADENRPFAALKILAAQRGVPEEAVRVTPASTFWAQYRNEKQLLPVLLHGRANNQSVLLPGEQEHEGRPHFQVLKADGIPTLVDTGTLTAQFVDNDYVFSIQQDARRMVWLSLGRAVLVFDRAFHNFGSSRKCVRGTHSTHLRWIFQA